MGTDDRRFHPVYEAASERGVPVVVTQGAMPGIPVQLTPALGTGTVLSAQGDAAQPFAAVAAASKEEMLALDDALFEVERAPSRRQHSPGESHPSEHLCGLRLARRGSRRKWLVDRPFSASADLREEA